MTVSKMLEYLGYRLDDPADGRYTSAIKLSALNAQLDEVVGLVHTGLLPDLQESTTMICISTGNNLPTDYFRYVTSRQHLLANRGWITKIDVDDLGELQDNQYTRGTDNNPLCYVWKDKYYLLVTTYGGNYDNVTLYYIKTPSNMVAGGSCPLSPVLHNVLCDLAESYLRATYKHGTLEEAVAIRKLAMDKLGQINEMYKRGLIV